MKRLKEIWSSFLKTRVIKTLKLYFGLEDYRLAIIMLMVIVVMTVNQPPHTSQALPKAAGTLKGKINQSKLEYVINS